MDVVFHAQTWPFPAAARHWPGLVRSGSQLRSQWIIMLKTGYFGPLDVSILVVVSILDTGCMLGIWLSLNKSKFPTNNGGLMGTSMNGVVFHCYVWLLGSRCSEWKDWEVAGRYSLHRLTELQLLLLAHGLDWKWCSPIQLVSSSPSCSYWDCLLGGYTPLSDTCCARVRGPQSSPLMSRRADLKPFDFGGHQLWPTQVGQISETKQN